MRTFSHIFGLKKFQAVSTPISAHICPKVLKRIHEEIKQIRLEQIAPISRLYKPCRFTPIMFNFANWMISTGKRLPKRFEVPAVNSNNPTTKGFAH